MNLYFRVMIHFFNLKISKVSDTVVFDLTLCNIPYQEKYSTKQKFCIFILFSQNSMLFIFLLFSFLKLKIFLEVFKWNDTLVYGLHIVEVNILYGIYNTFFTI